MGYRVNNGKANEAGLRTRPPPGGGRGLALEVDPGEVEITVCVGYLSEAHPLSALELVARPGDRSLR